MINKHKEFLDRLYKLRDDNARRLEELESIRDFDGNDPCCLKIHKLKCHGYANNSEVFDDLINRYLDLLTND